MNCDIQKEMLRLKLLFQLFLEHFGPLGFRLCIEVKGMTILLVRYIPEGDFVREAECRV